MPCARIVCPRPDRARQVVRVLVPPLQAREVAEDADAEPMIVAVAVIVAQIVAGTSWTASTGRQRIVEYPTARNERVPIGRDAPRIKASDVAQEMKGVRAEIADHAGLARDLGVGPPGACLCPPSSRGVAFLPRRVLGGNEADRTEMAVARQPGGVSHHCVRGVAVGHGQYEATLLCESHQLGGALRVTASVASHRRPKCLPGQESAGDCKVAVVRRRDGNRQIDAVGSLRLAMGHLRVVGVDAIMCHTQLCPERSC